MNRHSIIANSSRLFVPSNGEEEENKKNEENEKSMVKEVMVQGANEQEQKSKNGGRSRQSRSSATSISSDHGNFKLKFSELGSKDSLSTEFVIESETIEAKSASSVHRTESASSTVKRIQTNPFLPDFCNPCA